MAGFFAFLPLHADDLGLAAPGLLLAVYALIVVGLRIVFARLPDQIGAARAVGHRAGRVGASGWRSSACVRTRSASARRDRGLRDPASRSCSRRSSRWRSSRVDETERGAVVGTTTAFVDLAFGLSPALLGLRSPASTRRSAARSSCRRSSPRSGVRRRRSLVAPADAPVAATRGRLTAPRTLPAMTIERVFVAGAGLMGHGIAQVHAAIGKHVVLYEPDLARAEAGRERIAGNLERAVAKGRLDADERDATLGRVQPTDDVDRRPPTRTSSSRRSSRTSTSSARCGASSTRRAPPATIFASNTSSISIDRLAEAVSRGAPRAVRRDALLQPGAGHAARRADPRPRDTSDATVEAIRELSAELGKQVIVSADRPGFIVNRILMPFLAEAMRAFEQGVGTAEDIDTGARVGLNHPMGPLELADFIGLDVCLEVMRVLEDGLGARAHAPAAGARRPRRRPGHLGQKTGQGFYTYPRAERSMAARRPGLGDEERLLQANRPRVRAARGRARPRSSATRPSASTARSSPGWASSG